MTNYRELTSALEDKSLTNALQRIEHFSTRNGFAELETWCRQELEGYSGSAVNVPSYRIGEVQWIDYVGSNVSERYRWSGALPGLTITDLLPPTDISVINGVAQLEREGQENGFAVVKPSKFLMFRDAAKYNALKIRYGNLPASEINNIFDNIRLEARRRLNGVLPKQSVTAVRYPTPKFNQIIRNDRLTQILEQRWIEAIAIYDAEAYLMTVVSLGAILEGILLAQVEQNLKVASTSTETPKDASGKPLPIKAWTLDKLIQVCH